MKEIEVEAYAGKLPVVAKVTVLPGENGVVLQATTPFTKLFTHFSTEQVRELMCQMEQALEEGTADTV